MLADQVSTGDLGLSVDDYKYSLVVLNVGSNVGGILASNNKNATCVLVVIKVFGRAVTWTYFFSEGAKELKKAAIDLCGNSLSVESKNRAHHGRVGSGRRTAEQRGSAELDRTGRR